MVTADQGGLSLSVRGDSDLVPIAAMACEPDVLTMALADWARTTARRDAVSVRVTGHLVQERTLRSIPRVKARQLEELVRFQQARYFRQNGHELVIRARRVPGGESGQVDAVAVEGRWLDAVVNGLRGRPVAILAGQASLVLEAPVVRGAAARSSKRATRALLLLAAVLWLGAPALWLGRLQVEHSRLASRLHHLSGAERSLQAARRALSSASATVTALHASGDSAAAVAGWIAAIGRALPDSSFLVSLVLHADGTGRLEGMALDPLATMTRLSANLAPLEPVLESPALSSGGTWVPFSVRLSRAST
jgi:hypothetical protein